MHNQALVGFSGRYRSAGRRAWIAVVLLGVVGFITLLSMIQDGSGQRIVEDARAGMLTTREATEFNASTAFVAFLYLGGVGLTAIAYLAWLSRTVDNAPTLGGGTPPLTPRWAIGWWFVPFANLVKPYQIVRDLHDRMAINRSSGGGWIVLAWWLLWIFGNVIWTVAARLPEPTDLDALAALFRIRGIGDTLIFLAAVLAIIVVLRIQWRADQRAETLGVRAPSSVVPPA